MLSNNFDISKFKEDDKNSILESSVADMVGVDMSQSAMIVEESNMEHILATVSKTEINMQM